MKANLEITTLDLSFRRKTLVGFTVGLVLYVVVIASAVSSMSAYQG